MPTGECWGMPGESSSWLNAVGVRHYCIVEHTPWAFGDLLFSRYLNGMRGV